MYMQINIYLKFHTGFLKLEWLPTSLNTKSLLEYGISIKLCYATFLTAVHYPQNMTKPLLVMEIFKF